MLGYLLLQNSQALISMPSELKMILLAVIALNLVLSIVKGLWKLMKIGIAAAIIYFGLTFLGVI